MFFKKKKAAPKTYDRENQKPMLKCSICNGEQVAGFLDIHTQAFEEIALIRSESDLNAFREEYGITGEIGKFY